MLSPSAIPYYYRWNSGAAYVQADWKVKPNFTVNLGMRYSLQKPRTELYNHQGFLDPAAAITVQLPKPCPLPDCTAASAALGLGTITQAVEIPFAFSGYGGRSRYLTPVHWLDFEPRIGFAWNPNFGGSRDWVIRGGYGISHAPLTGQNRNAVPSFSGGAAAYGETAGQTNPNYVTRLSSNPPYDPGVNVDTALGLTANSNGLVYGKAINFPGNELIGDGAVPYSQNWSLSIQRKVSERGVLELSYVGAKGTHLFMPSVVLNNPPASYLAALQNLNVKATSTVADPLGRTTLAGTPLSVPLYSLDSAVMGYTNISSYSDRPATAPFTPPSSATGGRQTTCCSTQISAGLNLSMTRLRRQP